MREEKPTAHILSMNKSSVQGLSYIQLIACPKGPHENPQQTVVKAVGCSLQNDNKSPLWKLTPTHLIVHGDVELVPTVQLEQNSNWDFIVWTQQDYPQI